MAAEHQQGGHSRGGHAHGSGSHTGHSHGGMAGGPQDADSARRLGWALSLTAGFMLAEVAGGLISGSLALIADAGHMLTDAAALLLSWIAVRQARRPATSERSYGHHRFQVLAAFVNGLSLLAVSVWIAIEAVRRFFEPVEILGGTMMAVAVGGLLVNVAAFLILNGGARENLNIRGAVLHVMGDLLGSVAAIVAAGVIMATGWTPIDPLLSVFVVVLILRSAAMLVTRSWHVLMEGTPEGFDLERLRSELAESVDGVRDVHHVHLWSLTPELPLLTLHATIDVGADHDRVLGALKRVLAERFAIQHATIQIERDACPDGAAAHSGP